MISRYPRYLIFLLGLLLIGWISLRLGDEQAPIKRGPSSTGTEGSSGLKPFLEAQGYSVTINSSPTPKLASDEIGVVWNTYEDEKQKNSNKLNLVAKAASDFMIKQGGTLILLETLDNKDFGGNQEVRWPITGEKTRAIVRSADVRGYVVTNSTKTYVKLAEIGDGELAFLEKYPKGTSLTVMGGMHENARLSNPLTAETFLKAVRSVAPPGTKLVLLASSAGDGPDISVTELLGPGFLGAWRQMLVLLGVVAWTLASRFGYPDVGRTKEQGQRQWVDAITTLFDRQKKDRFAIQIYVKGIEKQIRRKFDIAQDVPIRDRNALLPHDLAITLGAAEQTCDSNLPDELSNEDLKRVKALREAADSYLRRR